MIERVFLELVKEIHLFLFVFKMSKNYIAQENQFYLIKGL